MPKLTDTQLVLLSRAAQRDDGGLEPPANLAGAAAQKVVARLVREGLVEEVRAAPGMPVWQRDESGAGSLLITPAGLQALGIEPPDEGSAEEAGAGENSGEPIGSKTSPDAAKTPRHGSKLAALVALLGRDDGASIADVAQATGWLPHTTRAALTGLRKRGYTIEKTRGPDGRTSYRLDQPRTGGAAPDVAGANGAA